MQWRLNDILQLRFDKKAVLLEKTTGEGVRAGRGGLWGEARLGSLQGACAILVWRRGANMLFWMARVKASLCRNVTMCHTGSSDVEGRRENSWRYVWSPCWDMRSLCLHRERQYGRRFHSRPGKGFLNSEVVRRGKSSRGKVSGPHLFPASGILITVFALKSLESESEFFF